MMKRGVTIVFIANIINMMFSIITSFILPKFLSIDSYGYYKVFQLYINYLGIAHLGFVDGIYLRYGGKEIQSIDADEILSSAATIRNMQIALTVIVVIISVSTENLIVILLALSCVPINMVSFYKNLFQATGEFKDYGTVLVVLPILMFVCNIILLFGFKTDDYIAYILVVFFSNLFLYILLEHKSSKMFGKIRLFTFNWRIFKENIVSGITLTIGNFASIMITSIDRWFIQAWMAISDFSYYSFAVSVENLFNVCVSAITTTLYNYLCKIKETDKITKLKTYCIFIGIYLVSVAFPVKFIIQFWLTKYDESINCLFILICAHSFYFVVKAIYVNLYKARGQQKHYLYQMLIILAIAVVANVITYYLISQTKEMFAYASLLTAIIWYFICYMEFKNIRGKFQETILLFICSGIYLACGLLLDNAVLGFIVYVCSTTFFAFVLCQHDFLIFFRCALVMQNGNLIELNKKGGVLMGMLRDLLRPLFRIVVKPHIKYLCKETENKYKSYKNKYDGKRCFVVANGPSLRMDDLERFVDEGEITFGMNRIYALYDRTKWRPTFYLSQDPTVLRSCINEIREQVNHSTVFVKVPGEPKYDVPGAINYDLDYTNVNKRVSPAFFDGLGCIFADGRSVTYTALQLAIYMGFTTIYLVGADCNYSKDNKSINNYSYPDKRMYDSKKVGVMPDMEYTFLAYKAAKKYAEEHGVKILNATRGGMLEVFDRVELDSLF